MKADHLAIDGSLVSLEADADLSLPVTTSGWAIVPSLQRAHPFTTHPPGHSAVVQAAMRESFEEIEFKSEEEYRVKGGALRVVVVEIPTAVESKRTLIVGAWEGESGCLATSVVESEGGFLVEMFDSLPFREHARGIAIDSQIVSRPRAPEVVKEIPEIGVVTIRPAIATEMERVPRGRGHETAHGELFRTRPDRNGLLFVGQSSLVSVNPFPDTDAERMLEVVAALRVDWSPRLVAVR